MLWGDAPENTSYVRAPLQNRVICVNNDIGHALFYTDTYIMFSCMDKMERIDPCFEANDIRTQSPSQHGLHSIHKNAPHVFRAFTSAPSSSSHRSQSDSVNKPSPCASGPKWGHGLTASGSVPRQPDLAGTSRP